MKSIDGWNVRMAGAADVAAVVSLERATAEAPHWAETGYSSIVDAIGVADSGVGGVRRCLLVAVLGNQIVGFAVGMVVGLKGTGAGELESVAVSATARRMGCGRALCGAVVEWCRGEGAAEVDLEVRAGSAGAIALYEGLGFVAVGRRPGYYRDPVEDALLMQLKLGA